MVVGDDDVDAKRAGARHSLTRAYAGIRAHQQLHAGERGLFDDIDAHAVTFAQPVGDVAGGAPARQVDGLLQNDDGRSSVDIVVAVQQDGLLAPDGIEKTRGGRVHIAHQEGIVQFVERSLEKSPGAGGFGMPAMNQHPRDRPAHA